SRCWPTYTTPRMARASADHPGHPSAASPEHSSRVRLVIETGSLSACAGFIVPDCYDGFPGSLGWRGVVNRGREGLEAGECLQEQRAPGRGRTRRKSLPRKISTSG